MKRNFTDWFNQFTDSIASWKFYTDFERVYSNVWDKRDSLNILNGLIGAKDIESEFKRIATKYPEVLSVIPILIAKRTSEIIINSADEKYSFNFKAPNYTIDEYAKFMKETGLFDLLQNRLVGSLVDYVLGVEVGMDTNGRKCRTGDAMKDLVEEYLKKQGLVKGETYFEEMYLSAIERKWDIDLSGISNTGKTEMRFNFVVKKDKTIYAIETNFYSGQGSKLNETARTYKTLALETKGIKNMVFVWLTDGKGWKSARHGLEEVFDIMEHIYCIKELEEGILAKVFK